MAIEDIDVVYSRERGWHLTLHGSYDTQAEAWEAANRIGRRLGRETFLRSLTGRWRKRNSHGSDPQNIPH